MEEEGRLGVEEVVARLWQEHKTAVLARDPESVGEISALVTAATMDPPEVMSSLQAVMAGRERYLSAAVKEAIEHLRSRIGESSRSTATRLANEKPEHGRWFAASLAEFASDGIVSSWRLFDHPAAVRRIWLRDREGPAMYVVRGDDVVRFSGAEVGSVLAEAFGDAAANTLSEIATGPRTPSEVAGSVGEKAPQVLEAAHRLLVLRRVAGFYRSRGEAVRVVLAGLGR